MTQVVPCGTITSNMPAPAPPEKRAHVLERAPIIGITAAAEEVGVSKSTASRWCTAEGVTTVPNLQTQAATQAAQAIRESLREELRTQLIARAGDMLDRMDDPKAQACQQYATAAAILIDKYRLEAGEVTGRHENVTADHLDREIQRLIGEAAK